jgi:hypothetical protein
MTKDTSGSSGVTSANLRYQGNDNLVQVSDWLTKILVGAGLVQLGRAPKALSELGNALRNGFGGGPSSAGFGLAVVLFYAVCGFVFLYLWSRLSLPKRLDKAETAEAVNQLKSETAQTVAAIKKGLSRPTTEPSQNQETAIDTTGPIGQRVEEFALAPRSMSFDLISNLAGAGLPRSSLNQVADEIEQELRRLLAATGHADAVLGSLDQMIQTIEEAANLEPGTLQAIRQFSTVQNLIAQQGSAVDPTVLRDAVDSGLEIVRALRSAPRDHNFVQFMDVPLFNDEAGQSEIDEARGVILRTASPDGTSTLRIFPTTRTDYQAGQEVSWEWNQNRQFGEVWFRDPADGTVKTAWRACLEFVGRDLSSF